MNRYICIHGHFYQPPRENPWIETIELQDSAYPYHDWNARISDECYRPNSASRILDGTGRIQQIVNNYSWISFNFGPTLLDWMEHADKETYQSILDADRESCERFGGHGSALAQVYNHVIMPLANSRDKCTQVIWGIQDFRSRFGRDPEGMWLAEAAVDLESLELLAEHGIKFTVLAPRQAHRVRAIGTTEWTDVTDEQIDPKIPYIQALPSGHKIAIFFYDGPISRGVAFEGLLSRGEALADRLLGTFTEDQGPQLVHIACDGETFGHHHKQGEMALTYALHYIESNNLAQIINYGQFLELHPPKHEVEIHENSSWSCIHGIERWRANCGCNSGMHEGWNQEWRAPLKKALDHLRDRLEPEFERRLHPLFKNPWKLRDDYIEILLNRDPGQVSQVLDRHARLALTQEQIVATLKALELQRHAMYMYTSCGWFFDELSGIETVQVIQYAARAIQLAQELWNLDVEPEFLAILENARCNVSLNGNGRNVYERFAKSATVDLFKVGAHYAVSSLFEDYPEVARIYCFTAERQDLQLFSSGRERLLIGRVRIISEITWEWIDLSFGVLHLGAHNITGGVRVHRGDVAYQDLAREGSEAFLRSDLTGVIRFMDNQFAAQTYSLRSLFRDEQRKILDNVLQTTLFNAEDAFRLIYDQNVPLMRFLRDLHIPQPEVFQKSAEYALNSRLRQILSEPDPNPERVFPLLDEANLGEVKLDADTLEFAIRQTLVLKAEQVAAHPEDFEQLKALGRLVDLCRLLPFNVQLHRTQTLYWNMLQHVFPERELILAETEVHTGEWTAEFLAIGEKLGMSIPEATEMGNEEGRARSIA